MSACRHHHGTNDIEAFPVVGFGSMSMERCPYNDVSHRDMIDGVGRGCYLILRVFRDPPNRFDTHDDRACEAL